MKKLIVLLIVLLIVNITAPPPCQAARNLEWKEEKRPKMGWEFIGNVETESKIGIINIEKDTEKFHGDKNKNIIISDDEDNFWSMRKLQIKRGKERIYKRWRKKMKFHRREDPKARKYLQPRKPYKNKRKLYTRVGDNEFHDKLKAWNSIPDYIRLENFTAKFITLEPINVTTIRRTRFTTTKKIILINYKIYGKNHTALPTVRKTRRKRTKRSGYSRIPGRVPTKKLRTTPTYATYKLDYRNIYKLL
ncbi:uncharacterized protein LOC142334055 [Lycorma delicatula]|uniref:uncharacterized protein LOC142334055 n=1 Tax=Lycorma delicatula TaxID=130591 RepID=UPI003F51A061